MTGMRIETDSLGEIEVPADRLWGAQTQRSLKYFSIGRDLMPPEMISAYAIVKKACADANRASGRLDADAPAALGRATREQGPFLARRRPPLGLARTEAAHRLGVASLRRCLRGLRVRDDRGDGPAALRAGDDDRLRGRRRC